MVTPPKTFVGGIIYLADSVYALRDSIIAGGKGIEKSGKVLESAMKEFGGEIHYFGNRLRESGIIIGAAVVLSFGMKACQEVTSFYIQSKIIQEERYQKVLKDSGKLHREIRGLRDDYLSLEKKVQRPEK